MKQNENIMKLLEFKYRMPKILATNSQVLTSDLSPYLMRKIENNKKQKKVQKTIRVIKARQQFNEVGKLRIQLSPKLSCIQSRRLFSKSKKNKKMEGKLRYMRKYSQQYQKSYNKLNTELIQLSESCSSSLQKIMSRSKQWNISQKKLRKEDIQKMKTSFSHIFRVKHKNPQYYKL